jgi:hypothetical protein
MFLTLCETLTFLKPLSLSLIELPRFNEIICRRIKNSRKGFILIYINIFDDALANLTNSNIVKNDR